MKSFFEFSGRASKNALCMFFLLNLILLIVLVFITSIMDLNETVAAALFIAYFLVALIGFMVLAVRRLRDAGKNSAWVAIILIPAVGIVWLWVLLLRNSVFTEKNGTKKGGQIFVGATSLVLCAAFLLMTIPATQVFILPGITVRTWSYFDEKQYLQECYKNTDSLLETISNFDRLDRVGIIGGLGWRLEPPLALLVTDNGQSRFIEYEKVPCANNMKSAKTLVHVEYYTFQYHTRDGKRETSKPRIKCTFYDLEKQAVNRFIEEISNDSFATSKRQKLRSLLDKLSSRIEFVDVGTFSDVNAKLEAIGYTTNYDKLRDILSKVEEDSRVLSLLPLPYKSANCVVVNFNDTYSASDDIPDFSQYKSPDFIVSIFPGGEKQTDDQILIFTRMFDVTPTGRYEGTSVTGYQTSHSVSVINLKTGKLIAKSVFNLDAPSNIHGDRQKDVIPLSGGEIIDRIIGSENVFKHSR